MTPFRSLSPLSHREQTNNPALPRMVEVDHETGEPLLTDQQRVDIARAICQAAAKRDGLVADDQQPTPATRAEELAAAIVHAGRKRRGEIA